MKNTRSAGGHKGAASLQYLSREKHSVLKEGKGSPIGLATLASCNGPSMGHGLCSRHGHGQLHADFACRCRGQLPLGALFLWALKKGRPGVGADPGPPLTRPPKEWIDAARRAEWTLGRAS